MRKSPTVTAYIDGLIECEGCGIYFAPKKQGGSPQRHCDQLCRARVYERRKYAEEKATRNHSRGVQTTD